jgi:hypothetical protein
MSNTDLQDINKTLININRSLVVLSLPEHQRKKQREYYSLLDQIRSLQKLLDDDLISVSEYEEQIILLADKVTVIVNQYNIVEDNYDI